MKYYEEKLKSYKDEGV